MTWIEILDSKTISAIRYDPPADSSTSSSPATAPATWERPISSTDPFRTDSKGLHFNEIIRDGCWHEGLESRG